MLITPLTAASVEDREKAALSFSTRFRPGCFNSLAKMAPTIINCCWSILGVCGGSALIPHRMGSTGVRLALLLWFVGHLEGKEFYSFIILIVFIFQR